MLISDEYAGQLAGPALNSSINCAGDKTLVSRPGGSMSTPVDDKLAFYIQRLAGHVKAFLNVGGSTDLIGGD